MPKFRALKLMEGGCQLQHVAGSRTKFLSDAWRGWGETQTHVTLKGRFLMSATGAAALKKYEQKARSLRKTNKRKLIHPI